MTSKAIIGWREWVGLPGLQTPWIKAKIDTGARSSSLHAFDVEVFERSGRDWVRFAVHPWQRSDDDAVAVEAEVIDWRSIKSSSGQSDERPVIRTDLRIGEDTHMVEVTLARRDEMGFRMLVGREALRRRFLVDPGRSYLSGKPERKVVVANRRRPTQLEQEVIR
jgi:hypothetical protein